MVLFCWGDLQQKRKLSSTGELDIIHSFGMLNSLKFLAHSIQGKYLERGGSDHCDVAWLDIDHRTVQFHWACDQCSLRLLFLANWSGTQCGSAVVVHQSQGSLCHAFSDAFLPITFVKSSYFSYLCLSVSWNQSGHSPLLSLINRGVFARRTVIHWIFFKFSVVTGVHENHIIGWLNNCLNEQVCRCFIWLVSVNMKVVCTVY